MNLYRISQSENNDYDTYDSAVVAAPDEATARSIHPVDNIIWNAEKSAWCYKKTGELEFHLASTWCKHPDAVAVTLIGTAHSSITQPGVILASFNAG